MYQVVEVLDQEGDIYGYGVLKSPLQLYSVNLYKEEIEAQSICADLNDRSSLLDLWPDANDPEVQYLVDDPQWIPGGGDQGPIWRLHKACELVAQERRKNNL